MCPLQGARFAMSKFLHSFRAEWAPSIPRELQAEGRMTAAGAEALARRMQARSAVYSHEQAVPAALSADELAAFQRHAVAWQFFAATPPGYQKVVLHWVCSAKKAETRSTRLAKLVEACAVGQRLR